MKHPKKQYFRTLLERFHEIIVFVGFLKVFLFFHQKTQNWMCFWFFIQKPTNLNVFVFFHPKNKNMLGFLVKKQKNLQKTKKTIISWNPLSSVRKYCFCVFHVFLRVLLFCVFSMIFKVVAWKAPKTFIFCFFGFNLLFIRNIFLLFGICSFYLE